MQSLDVLPHSPELSSMLNPKVTHERANMENLLFAAALIAVWGRPPLFVARVEAIHWQIK